MGDGVSRDKRTSVPIADVPDAPLSTSGFDASTDTLTAGSLCRHATLDRFHGSKDGGVSLAFLDDEPVAHFVAVLQVGGKFVCHVPIVRGDQADWVIMEDTLSGVTVIHAMGSPLAGHFQITMGSPYFANHTEQRR